MPGTISSDSRLPSGSDAAPLGPGVVLPGIIAERASSSAIAAPSPVDLSRGELSLLFGVCKRTVARWQLQHVLPHDQKNARVIRYSNNTVVELLALGYELNRREAEQFGLVVEELFTQASSLRKQKVAENAGVAPKQSEVFVPRDDEEQKILQLIRHPEYGRFLRAFAISISSH